MRIWQRLLREPQTLLLRRALFQIHLWVGIAAGLYIAVISLSGSILVYRNEMYRAFSPVPRLVQDAGVPLSPEDLEQAVRRTFPSARRGGGARADAEPRGRRHHRARRGTHAAPRSPVDRRGSRPDAAARLPGERVVPRPARQPARRAGRPPRQRLRRACAAGAVGDRPDHLVAGHITLEAQRASSTSAPTGSG